MAARSCHECFSLWLFLFPFRCWVSMMQACKSLVWPKPAKYHISCLEACKFLLVTVLSIQSQLSVTGSFQAAADAHTRSSIPRASKIKPDRDRQHFMRHYLTDVLVSLCPPLSLSHSKTFMQNYSQVDTFSSWMLNFQLLLFKVKRKHFPAIHPLSLCHALKPDKVVILEINKQKAHMETSGWSSQCDSWRRSCLTLRLVHI